MILRNLLRALFRRGVAARCGHQTCCRAPLREWPAARALCRPSSFSSATQRVLEVDAGGDYRLQRGSLPPASICQAARMIRRRALRRFTFASFAAGGALIPVRFKSRAGRFPTRARGGTAIWFHFLPRSVQARGARTTTSRSRAPPVRFPRWMCRSLMRRGKMRRAASSRSSMNSTTTASSSS